MGIKAVRIKDENLVEYSMTKINKGHFDYIPKETLVEKELSLEEMDELKQKLSAVRWAICHVADRNDVVTIPKRWTPNEYYLEKTEGPITTHTLGPHGMSSNYNSAWQDISDLILNVKWTEVK